MPSAQGLVLQTVFQKKYKELADRKRKEMWLGSQKVMFSLKKNAGLRIS